MRTRGVISSYSRAQPRMAFGFYKRHKRTKAQNRKPLPLQSLLPIARILSALSVNPYLIYAFPYLIYGINRRTSKKKNATTIYIYNKTKTHLFILTAFCGSKFKITDYLNIIIDLFLYIFICLDRHLSILLFICFDSIIFVYVFILLFLSMFICLYFYSCTYFFICVYICLCSRKKIQPLFISLFCYSYIYIIKMIKG